MFLPSKINKVKDSFLLLFTTESPAPYTQVDNQSIVVEWMDFISPQPLFLAMESQSFEPSSDTQSHLAEQGSNSGLFVSYPSPLLPHTAATGFPQATCRPAHSISLNHTLSHIIAFSFLSSGLLLSFLNLVLPPLSHLYLYCYCPPYNLLHCIPLRLLFSPVTLQFHSYVFTQQKCVDVYQKHALEFSQQHYS